MEGVQIQGALVQEEGHHDEHNYDALDQHEGKFRAEGQPEAKGGSSGVGINHIRPYHNGLPGSQPASSYRGSRRPSQTSSMTSYPHRQVEGKKDMRSIEEEDEDELSWAMSALWCLSMGFEAILVILLFGFSVFNTQMTCFTKAPFTFWAVLASLDIPLNIMNTLIRGAYGKERFACTLEMARATYVLGLLISVCYGLYLVFELPTYQELTADEYAMCFQQLLWFNYFLGTNHQETGEGFPATVEDVVQFIDIAFEISCALALLLLMVHLVYLGSHFKTRCFFFPKKKNQRGRGYDALESQPPRLEPMQPLPGDMLGLIENTDASQ
eukprot:g81696.t1